MPHRSASTERAVAVREWAAGLAAVAILAAGIALGIAWREASRPIVIDSAGLLAEEERAHMERLHRLLLRDHDLDYRVELVRGVGPLDRYAHQRFAELGVGERSASARGLLLVLDPESDAVRLEVGQSLEGVLPDAFVAYLEQRQMVPYFRAGQVGSGVLAASELLVTRIQEARERAAWQSEPGGSGSGGGGARTQALLDRGRDSRFAEGPEVEAGDSPAEAVRAYLAAMNARNGNPRLDLYTRGTRAMLDGRVVTPAQMDALVRAYRGCRAEPPRVSAGGRHAVVRYPAEARRCAPFLLAREEGRWRLDFETAARAIRFGRSNAWRLLRSEAGPYVFAFEDWDFDAHGFPVGARGDAASAGGSLPGRS